MLRTLRSSVVIHDHEETSTSAVHKTREGEHYCSRLLSTDSRAAKEVV